MTYTPKRWISLGLGAALLGTAGLAACGGEGGEAGETGETGDSAVHGEAGEAGAHTETHAESTAPEAAYAGEGGEMGEGEGGEGEGGGVVSTAGGVRVLPVEKRVAFMSGHVEAGLALYRAGFPEMAAKHLMHPVSETHSEERAGIDAFGFEQDLFLNVSAALEEGKPAGEIEPQLAAAEDNMRLLQENAGGDPADLIAFLMEVCLDEYQAGVTYAEITNAGEYQDAYGFAIVARDYASRLEDSDALVMELELLVRMWPSEGPVITEAAAPISTVAAQIARVQLELSSL